MSVVHLSGRARERTCGCHVPGLLAGWLRDVRRAKEKERERACARGMRERASVRACDCKREARERGAVGNSSNRDEWREGVGDVMMMPKSLSGLHEEIGQKHVLCLILHLPLFCFAFSLMPPCCLVVCCDWKLPRKLPQTKYLLNT